LRHFLATLLLIHPSEKGVTLGRVRHGRPALRAILPRTPPTPTTPLRGLACLLFGAASLARHRPPIRLRPRHPPQSGLPVPRPMPCRSSTPLFFSPPRGRPLGGTASDASPRPERPATADCRALALNAVRSVHTRVAGVFLFLPLLAQLGFDRLVENAGYPGSRMVPAVNALLSLLILKLLDKERHSHINDFNFD